MIHIDQLKESDVGRWVERRSHFMDLVKVEKGRLKSWKEGGVNGGVANVVYNCANWDRFKEYGGFPTYPECLSFCDPIEEGIKK